MCTGSASTGIRSLAINPSRTLLAVGSGEPFQVTVYSLPEFVPVGSMYGHTDLVFSLTWVSDTVLVTGSRDGSMKVWTMRSPVLTTLPTISGEVEVRLSDLTKSEDNTKIRDLTFNRKTQQLMTLTTEGFVKLWDCGNYAHLSKIKLPYANETVCLSTNSEANLYAVGSQTHISIIDPRVVNVVHNIESCDEGWGVRSLDFKSHIVTTGGGYGRIGFYDMRAQRYLKGFDDGKNTRYYQDIGRGWLNRDTAYAATISGLSIRNAIYAMEYDSTGTRLLASGGPLQLGLSGAYVGLWE
ncbi:WD40-repeat-containing domain protein [Lobosporangium transversale]|uniref:WD40-repeat-containing domain protein n=1 Tax=Lobosporangium transversale TaxID=64571 RepID=A0A1Y2GZW1_9FUNG|nr:WD40-repeat-containing domain protein [Lobosporangium transversale]ORZ26352.1 WD40-repeat-containing domain protein [Lobosporangium transversale]|eukprot:XP_021884117.1 WD40-repeat-containing domain protein [Lobosporangium transversale]